MRHYVDERQLRSASKPCRRCKSKIVGPAVALGYRGGRGNYLSDVFHPACAAEVPRPSAHELPFWDCGSLFDSFHEILSQIPLERREYRAVKRMLDALLAELVD